jgi:hypothetical protein
MSNTIKLAPLLTPDEAFRLAALAAQPRPRLVRSTNQPPLLSPLRPIEQEPKVAAPKPVAELLTPRSLARVLEGYAAPRMVRTTNSTEVPNDLLPLSPFVPRPLTRADERREATGRDLDEGTAAAWRYMLRELRG